MTDTSRPKPVSAAFRTFRDVWRFLIPGNFHSGEGELVQHTEGWLLDAFAETCRQTALLMFPSVAPSDALEKIGKDRGIPRGFSEPDASYRERLRAWRYPRGHRIRGNATGLLEQISAVFGGAVEVQTIDARGTRYTWGEDGATTVERGVAWDWDGSPLTPNWARFWVVIRPVGAAPQTIEDLGTIGSDPELCVGVTGVVPGQINAIRALAKVGRLSWTPAGCRPYALVIMFDDGSSFPVPGGDWGDWENRSLDYRYASLHADVP
jgi:hypothetical protein